MISDYKGKNVSFDNMRIHNTVVAKYKKDGGVATITFASSYEYYLNIDGKTTKTQDRARVEFIYVYDMKEVEADKKQSAF